MSCRQREERFSQEFSAAGLQAGLEAFIARRTSQRYFSDSFRNQVCREEIRIPTGADRISYDIFGSGTPWKKISEQVLSGRYRFKPFAEEERAKKTDDEGNVLSHRVISTCCVQDALLQFIALEILNDEYDQEFSDCSYAYRPGRSVPQAVRKVKSILESGWTWVAESDIRGFFDRLSHAVLERVVSDKLGNEPQEMRSLLTAFYTAPRLKAHRVKKWGGLHYLSGGFPLGLIACERKRGLPQGGALSGFLANLVLDDFDKLFEQQNRDTRLVRYADDFLLFGQSRRAAKDGLFLAEEKLAELGLEMHPDKTKLRSAFKGVQFVGHYFKARRGAETTVSIRAKTMERHRRMLESLLEASLAKTRPRCPCRVNELLGRKVMGFESRVNGENRPSVKSWVSSFKAINNDSQLRELDAWLARRFRKYLCDYKAKGLVLCRACGATGPGRLESYTRTHYELKRVHD